MSSGQTLALQTPRSAARAREAQAKERAAKGAAEARKPARDTGKVRNPILFERLEAKIMALEGDIEALQAAMLQADNYSSATRMRELQEQELRLKEELQAAYLEWENWQ